MERDEMELQSKRDYLCRMAKLVDSKPTDDHPIDPELILSFEDQDGVEVETVSVEN